MFRFLKWAIGVAIVQGLLLILLAWLLSGFVVRNVPAALTAGLVFGIGFAALWPVIYQLSARIHPILFPILSFALTGLMLVLLVDVVNLIYDDAVSIDGIWTGILVALGLTVGNTVIGALFGLDDDRAYDRYVTRQIRRSTRGVASSTTPGVLFLEIDGLSAPILHRAIEGGYMPTLQRWIESGSHQLRVWEPDLSSQTSASQAGILLGSNWGIPAFRWWDKPLGMLMVSSKRTTARALETQLSTGNGLLAAHGASRWNVFSGDATDCLGTFSRIGDKTASGQRSYLAYFTNPYCLARTISLFFIDVVRELFEASRQRATNVLPRVHRGFKYAFIRAGTTVLLQESSRFMLTADMYRGVPVVYNTFFAYDEVAHHSGIDRLDSMKVLRTLDRVMAHFERVAQTTPRPYHLVVLSDHGQSQGATFKQRYGKTLAEVVSELIGSTGSVTQVGSGDEGLGGINSALTEAIQHDSRSMNMLRRATRSNTSNGEVQLGSEADQALSADVQKALQASEAVVVASGNLGLISFPRVPERMTYEQLTSTYPGLLKGLAEHPGVSFVMAHTEDEGAVVVGAKGVIYLADGHVAGEDPLRDFGPNAANHLKRTDSFPNAPDILVMSQIDHDTGEVAAFEELVGCHGGLGGPQTQPFVLYPAALKIESDQPIIGAGHLHRVLKSWVDGQSAIVPDGTGQFAATGGASAQQVPAT
ncbi:MAG TPA: alkaline phosphatase family protein [Thermomicrobiales bacterium]|nr:alkaline phosphatase family protein [Thermomicrobiales bacterium]